MKIRTKIMMLFAALTVSIIVAMSFFVYYFATQYSFEDFYKRLEIRAYLTAKAAIPSSESFSSIYNEIREENLEVMPSEQEFVLRVDPVTKQVQTSHNLELPAYFYREAIALGKTFYREGDRFFAGVYYHNNEHAYLVIVSAINHYSAEYSLMLRKILVISSIFAALMIMAGGYFFSRVILRPIRNMMTQVKSISSRNLHSRLETGGNKDEMNELAATFNNMLDRLETSFETQNNFVSNASHELSTPLTAIIGEAELSLCRDRSQENYVQAIRNILREAERLEHITKSLLHLAQTGFDGQKQDWGPIRTDELLFSVKEVVDKIHPDNHVEIDYSLFPEEDEKLVIQGNFQLLELALSNIVLNAIKYSDNQPVSMALAATDKKNFIIVKDRGIGIPQEDLPYIFSPFFRASNTGKFKGYGIGLPLAQNIIRMHKGEIVVFSKVNMGTEIRLELPI
ncbi:two-component sensor histidine kinase [Chitinophaga caeni]|uniref:histidine kinase n=1 Tax=Chitinophaga caeni TaxID=2029983 RepID=A0A291QVQ4_9BACT|nr:HAMP domain-containing sensor histidine kinase [Chitinophaga caeni]ATL47944.1 two-component sensor histidine kinase [Chitinophaga caeni]